MNRRFRHIALWTLAAVMTVGCGSATEEETELPVSPQPGSGTPIAFSGNLSDEGDVTRTDPTEPTGLETVLPEGNKKFRVWAYKNDASGGKQTVMEDYIVNWVANTAYTTTSNTHDWEYVNQQTDSNPEQTIKYWDWGAAAYRFFGYTGENIAVSKDDNDNEVSVEMPVNGTGTLPYYSRLWYGTPSDDFFGKAVQLVFLQPITQVRIKFTFAEGLGIDQTALSDIQFRPTPPAPGSSETQKSIPTQGYVEIYYPLTGTAIKESFTSHPDFVNTINWLSTADIWYNVLPRESQISYTLSVVVVGGAPQTAVVPAEYMTWAPGYQYTYIFKVTETGGITLDNIQVGINDWHLAEQVTHPVYNW